MNKADKILKDAAKIANELYPAYGHVQTPIETLDSTVKASSDFIATIYEPSACLCLRGGKMMGFRASGIATTRKNSCNTACQARFIFKAYQVVGSQYVL